MKKVVPFLLTVILTLSMLAVPALAAVTNPNVSDDDYTYYKATAKSYYPTDYTNIYGVKFNIKMGASENYLAFICVDDNAVSEAPVKMFCDTGLDSWGYAPPGTEIIDIAANASGDLEYLSTTPLFSSGSTVASARLAASFGDLSVNSVTWLDAAGDAITTDNLDYVAYAKAFYPSNYTEIYGIQFKITMGEGWGYAAAIFTENNAVTTDEDAPGSVYNSSALAASVGGTTLDINAGDSGVFEYKSNTPIFTSGASLAQVRLVNAAVAFGGSQFTVDEIIFLGQDGNKLAARTLTLSSACELTALTTPSGTISGTNVTASVANDKSSVTVAATVSDKATWDLYNDSACTTKITDKNMNLNVGANTAYIKVVAEDGTSKVYTLTVTRASGTTSSNTTPTESTPTDKIPETGDNSSAMVWILLMIASSGAVVLATRKTKARNH